MHKALPALMALLALLVLQALKALPEHKVQLALPVPLV